MKFRVIDNKTGKEAYTWNIALHEEWAQSLVYCDMEGFLIAEDGALMLADECGHVVYCDPERFKVEFEPDRPHGKWIRKDYSDQMAWATCSICRKKEYQIYNESPDATEETMVICKPFCPNCGADMRKREGGKE